MHIIKKKIFFFFGYVVFFVAPRHAEYLLFIFVCLQGHFHTRRPVKNIHR